MTQKLNERQAEMKKRMEQERVEHQRLELVKARTAEVFRPQKPEPSDRCDPTEPLDKVFKLPAGTGPGFLKVQMVGQSFLWPMENPDKPPALEDVQRLCSALTPKEFVCKLTWHCWVRVWRVK